MKQEQTNEHTWSGHGQKILECVWALNLKMKEKYQKYLSV